MLTPPSNSTTLISLALLKRQFDKGKDYYDYLMPFIEQIFIDDTKNFFQTDEIQRKMESDFGLKIPSEVIRLVLVRMKRKNYLTFENNVFSKAPHFRGINSDSKKAEVEGDINLVVNALIEFANSARNQKFTPDQAILAIQRFLGDFSIECIKSYVQKTALPDIPEGKGWEKILVARFLVDEQKNNYLRFEKFMILVQGNMLANALISSDTSTPPKTYGKTTFILILQICFMLLGTVEMKTKSLLKKQ